MKKKLTIAVGLSGGVDSSVAAYLLKKQGHQVIGLFMKNWEETDSSGQCLSSKDFADVQRVCEHLDIPYYAVDFVQPYRDEVFQIFLEDLKRGMTPNPDILCNQKIKFHHFLNKALEMGADLLATGHYSQVIAESESYQLVKGADPQKDQTYFLYTANQSVLSKVAFPIGHLEKKQVRAIAKEAGLSTHDKKDSTGICFIGKRPFKSFIEKYIAYQKGLMKTLDGKVVGEHDGVAFYTIGQRKGLMIGGPGEAWFVVDKDLQNNVLYVCQGKDHPSLYRAQLIADQLSWVNGSAPSLPFSCHAKIRYRQEDTPCVIEKIDEENAAVRFLAPQRAITVGQSIVFYQGQICLGGGRIKAL